MTHNPMLPMYCEWTLEDGCDCLMLAVAIMTTDNHEHWTCMPHAREFYRWLANDFGDGPPTITPLYRDDSHEAAAADRAYKLAHLDDAHTCEYTANGADPTPANPACGKPATVCNPHGLSGKDDTWFDYDEWYCATHADQAWLAQTPGRDSRKD